MNRQGLTATAALLVALASTLAQAAIFTKDHGDWPKDWPAELEPLRESSRTIGVATGVQEDIYEIPIPDRETFEKVWAAALQVRTPGSPIRLSRAGGPSKMGRLLNQQQAAVRIYAPTGGFSSKQSVDLGRSVNFDELIAQGRALRAGPPWPEYLAAENGALPEYVVAETNDEGKLIWEAADPFEDQKEGRKPRGFYNRARVEVELVIDGQTIDLNQVKLPGDARVLDHRFAEQP